MHIIQKKILQLAENEGFKDLTLRKIAELINEDPKKPQKIKHHIQKLELKGLLKYNKETKSLHIKKPSNIHSSLFVSIPLYGSANCGVATFFADDCLEGYLKVSKSILNCNKTKGLFALTASGSSMNQSVINGNNIDDGDFLIVDSNIKKPKNNDVIVSIIDGLANVKKFKIDNNNQIVLISESSKDCAPIYIHQNDIDNYEIAGKVIQVIKKPHFD